MSKGYVVRGKDDDGDTIETRCKTPNEAVASYWISSNDWELTDVRILAIAEDGTETPLPTYEEALAEIVRLRQVEAIRVSEIEAVLSRHRAAFGIADPPGVAEVHERAEKARGEKAPISTRPGRCGGEPCISGTRLTVRAVQSFETAETARAAYPHVTREQIEAARAYPMPPSDDALDEPQASSSLTVPSEDQGPLREIIVKMTTARG